MPYYIGDKVKLLPHSTERAAYQGLPASIVDVVFGAYTVMMDEDQAMFFGLTATDIEPYSRWQAPARRCTCDLIRGGCTCEVGRAELAAERAKRDEES